MTSDMEKAPPEQSGALTNMAKQAEHNTRGDIGLATELLRALVALPAARVVHHTAQIDPRDLHDDRHRTILTSLDGQARRLIDAEQAHAPVPATMLQLDLQQSGDLAKPHVASLLIDVATGTPAPEPMIDDIIAGLKYSRLRRACETAGNALVTAAGSGSRDDVATAIANAIWLPGLAQRAGLGGSADE